MGEEGLVTNKAAPEEGTLTEKAAQLLQREILQGVLEPGARLAVIDLSERYGIGATPIREALSRLTSQNLVAAVGRRGFHVRGMNYEDLHDITRVRFLVEQEALRLSMRQGGDEWEGELVASLHRLQLYVERAGSNFGAGGEQFDQLHHQFHAKLIGGSGSPRLTELARDLYNQAYRYRRSNMRRLIDAEDFMQMHRVLAHAALSRDETRALELLHEHLNSTLANVYPDRERP
ncbi:FCD domain-containing protein [Sinirhodobacter populi]|nr:FCD domain-containing protein [Sinirhodobacter populi]